MASPAPLPLPRPTRRDPTAPPAGIHPTIPQRAYVGVAEAAVYLDITRKRCAR